MSEISRSIMAPTAAPGMLLELISNISSSTVDAPRVVPHFLQQRLHSIAAKNGGQVALHGRLFLQWLHFAFPYECPFPNLPEEMEAGLKNLKSGETKMVVEGEEHRADLSANYSRINLTFL